MKKICIVTNMPTPYRTPIYNYLSKNKSLDIVVIYCSARESNRTWSIERAEFKEVYLKEKVVALSDGYNYRHNNLDVFKVLNVEKPDVVISCGFNFTHLYAFTYSLIMRKKHIVMTDGWDYTEKNLSFFHRLARKIVFYFSQSSIAVGEKGKELFLKYSSDKDSVFVAPLVPNIKSKVKPKVFLQRDYDVCFSGLEFRKNPDFVINVLRCCDKNTKSAFVGGGDLYEDIKKKALKYGLDITFFGQIEPLEVFDIMCNSRIFLFPTKSDAWGLVADEAMSAGCVVIVSPFCGAANDLIQDKSTGYILDLEVLSWADKIEKILQWKSNTLLKQVGNRLSEVSVESSACKIIEAIEFRSE